MKSNKKLIGLAVVGGIVCVAAIAAGLYLNGKPVSLGREGTVEAVSVHYLLPDEEPAIATVEDKTKVNSEFLRAAEDGDKLLIYKEAKKVILYRPSIDRIVEVGPISIAPASEGTTTE